MDMKILREICTFVVLLALICIQVVIYQYDHGTERHDLPMDKAALVFFNKLTTGNLSIQQVSSDCYRCKLTQIPDTPLQTGENITYQADTRFPITLVLANTNTGHTCNLTHHFREYGLHYFNWSQGESVNCSYSTLDEGDLSDLPILYAAVVIGALSVIWIIAVKIYNFITKKGDEYRPILKEQDEEDSIKDGSTHVQEDPYENGRESSSIMYGSVGKEKKKRRSSKSADPSVTSTLKSSLIIKGTSDAASESPKDTVDKKIKKRLHSLDAFRGLSLTVMIFVNYGGGGYWFLNHSRWNGLTVADLVFPWFVWIMGVSMVFSFRGRRKDGFLQQLYQILRRTVILFGFGLFIISNDSSKPLSHMRICGVLQRLATSYFVVALTELLANQLYKRKNFSVWSVVRDLTNNCVQWGVVIVLEVLWLLITFVLPVSHCPRGYLGAGGIAEGGQYPNCTGGAARVVDYWILGEHHMYGGSTAKNLYQLQVRFEPEGILGTLNSIVLCFLGVQAGRTLLYFRGRHVNIIARFLAWGVALSALATLLCLGQKDEGIIPVNKNLWSLSFILLLAGFAYLLLAVFYLIIDTYPLWTGAPFIYPGMNSILVYMGHEVLQKYFPFSVYGQEETHLTFLSSNLVSVATWLLISYYWFSVQFFVKI